MPSKSRAQHNLMAGVCTGKIKKTKIPKKVACDYMHADKGKKFSENSSEENIFAGLADRLYESFKFD
jgi:hypothetical protein